MLPFCAVPCCVAACSQDFLNGVCTHIIWLTQRKLTYYTGNYDTFKKTVAENEVGAAV
jgi:ATP-binding cassette subfamily F protein 2